ncbi:GNAT family N-acetyltransferase [Burkholderia gladioli]|uniref:GNAT family N-acetyltransferase n=1 Tax=Burkholderia gladioli TaxID=28095 RepID=UPI001641F549|nr:GNAT family N-acetyltransferase [Burkholderia gladioli]
MRATEPLPPSVEELLAFDTLTLREHTEQAGDAFDPDAQRERLRQALAAYEIRSVRRDGELVAYAMLRPESARCWFVGAFGIHPRHRGYGVLGELLAKLAELAGARGIREFRSHVYRTNRLSIAFHRKLGFRITRENDKGFEFVVTLDELANHAAILRATRA